MPNLKEVRTRIESVKSTQQITSAMKMVAASKLRRAQNAILKMRPYASKLNEILQNLSTTIDNSAEGIYSDDRQVKKVLIICIASNRGLCGAFNANVMKETNRRITETYAEQNENGDVYVYPIGKKIVDFYTSKGYNVAYSDSEIFDNLNFENAVPIAEKLMKDFANKEYDKIEIIYNQFKNAATQALINENFLPIVSSDEEDEDEFAIAADYIFEPNKEDLVHEMIPKSLKIQLYKTLLDSFASEHGARMTAMHKATDNAEELLKDLKLKYNKARQATITNEILEIVSGAEALKG